MRLFNTSPFIDFNHNTNTNRNNSADFHQPPQRVDTDDNKALFCCNRGPVWHFGSKFSVSAAQWIPLHADEGADDAQ